MLHARATPGREAIVDARRRLTFGELDGEINRLAHALAARGVGPGERVVVQLPNGIESVVALQALPRVGAIAAQAGARLKRGELGHILANARPRAVVYHADLAEELEAALAVHPGAAPARIVVGRGGDEAWEAALAGHDGARPPAARTGDAGGVIVYTSGTTGRPRGARRGWAKTGVEPAADLISSLGMRRDERHLVVAPLYHSAALGFATMTLLVGGTVVIEDGFAPEATLAAIARERITSLVMVPTMLHRLIELGAATRAAHDLASLRWVLSAAAPLTTETARRFQAAYGPRLWNLYGATETGLVALAGPADHAARPGTVGRILRGNDVRILDEGGAARPPGAIGEVFVANEMLVEGYHDDPAATAAARRADAFSVGDLGRVDADGYLYLESRTHDMIISGGVNIYPAEIEAHLATHPDVVEAAVVGAPDPEWGERVVAYVVARAGATLAPEDVTAHCRAGLADYKQPRRVVLVDELPRNPTGKVLKRELRARPA
jgi:fatty-acyl-CoA synthase